MRNGAMAPALTRITTRYVAHEDRVRLAGELAGAGEVTVWLTFRLLNQLLPRLLSGLEQQRAHLSRGEALRGEILQGFAQRKAMAEMTPSTPVRVGNNAATWLAEAVVISRSANGVTLIFRAGDGQEVLLPLKGEALRQWLAIVYRAYGDAAWPGAFWPAWLVESAQPTAPSGLTVH
jgi:hypothetical protein